MKGTMLQPMKKASARHLLTKDRATQIQDLKVSHQIDDKSKPCNFGKPSRELLNQRVDRVDIANDKSSWRKDCSIWDQDERASVAAIQSKEKRKQLSCREKNDIQIQILRLVSWAPRCPYWTTIEFSWASSCSVSSWCHPAANWASDFA